MKGAVDKMLDRTTTGLAGAWVISPFWWDGLQAVSDAATLLAPILSVAWLALKVARGVADWRRGRAASE